MPFEVDQARISVVSAGQDEEVIMHPTDHPKVGELEHFVHDPHHLHIKTVFAACGQSRVMVGLKIMRMTNFDNGNLYENNEEDDDAEACQVDIVNLVAKADS